MAYTTPLLEGLGLRADTPLITSNGAVIRTLDGRSIDRCHMEARVARGLCGLLRPFGAVVFTFDRPGRGELVLEDLEQVNGRIALWVETNRHAIEVFKPLEKASRGWRRPHSGHGHRRREQDEGSRAERSRQASGQQVANASAPNIQRAMFPSSICLPPGVSKGWALERLASSLGVSRAETMAIGDNWNDVAMLEWAGQAVVMGNAAQDLRTMAKTRGWKQAPSNDDDGVAVVLEKALKQTPAARAMTQDSWFSGKR